MKNNEVNFDRDNMTVTMTVDTFIDLIAQAHRPTPEPAPKPTGPCNRMYHLPDVGQQVCTLPDGHRGLHDTTRP